jgi:glycosyltransferase involved in cell wall biosynthesis
MLGWELPPYNSGGLGVACYQLAKALASHGADIQFILPSSAKHDNPSFMTVLSPTLTPQTQVVSSAALNPYGGDIEGVRALQDEYEGFVEEVIALNQPDVIHAHDWLTLGAGMKAKQLSGVPLVAHVHATEFDRAGGGNGNPLIHEIEQHGLLMADHIVAVSNATKQLIVERYNIPADKIEVIHNSAEVLSHYTTDIAQYRYIERLKQEGYTVVATIGRLTLQKGLSHFLRAAALAHARYGRFVFVIAGDGEQRDELITLSADLGISDAVLFTGFVRGQALRDVYNLADVFIMSSVSEPFGLTALEAAQHRTAISITNQSGVREVLHGALSYDYWDERRLADQLVALALSDALRDELAHNAAREVMQMSWHKVARRFVDRYQVLKGAAV